MTPKKLIISTRFTHLLNTSLQEIAKPLTQHGEVGTILGFFGPAVFDCLVAERNRMCWETFTKQLPK